MKLKFSLLFLIIFSVTAFAESSPVPMLQSTTNQVITALKENQATLKSNPKTVYRIINTIIVPHFELTGMARSVLPRNVWMAANEQQRLQFTHEFTQLLVRTYSSALESYKNEKVQYLPIRSASNNHRMQVNSEIIRQGGPAISVSYRLIMIGSQWKVYDFSVDGISLLQSYRSQFAAQLSSGGGIEAVIQKLSQHNA